MDQKSSINNNLKANFKDCAIDPKSLEGQALIYNAWKSNIKKMVLNKLSISCRSTSSNSNPGRIQFLI